MNGRSASATFAGREREFGLIASMIGELDVTGARTVLIGGAAGIGKSRLVDEVCQRARAAGALVGVGACLAAEGNGLPYAPIVGALREYGRVVDARTAEVVFGPARRALGLGGDAPVELGKTRLFDSLLEGFTNLAERSLVLLVLEDLHWADSASLEVFEFLARNLRESPVLLIGTYRDDEVAGGQPLHRLTAELARLRRVTTVQLAALDREATGLLMRDILGAAPNWAILDAVYARSGGNPFFAEVLTEARDERVLPIALRNVVMLRVDALSDDTRQLVSVAAVIGGAVDHALLATTCDLSGDAFDRAIAEAVTQHVLEVRGDGTYVFRHELQREAVYESLLPSERARTHRRVAEALAAEEPNATFELAGHWWSAGAWAEAYPAAVAAGDAMARLFAMPDACSHYERAIAALRHLDAPDDVDLLLKTANAAYLSHDGIATSAPFVDRAVAAINEHEDPRRAAVARRLLARNQWGSGDTDAAIETLAHAASLVPAELPTLERAAIIAEEARCLAIAGRIADAAPRAHEALALARAVGAPYEEAGALNVLSICLFELGKIDEALENLHEALTIAEERGFGDMAQRAYGNLTHVMMNSDRAEEAVQLVLTDDDALTSSTVRFGATGTNLAEALIRLGRYGEAEAVMERVDDIGIANCAFGPHGARAQIDLRRGRLESAALHIKQAEELSAGNKTIDVRVPALILRADLALEEARPGAAYEAIEQALALAAGSADHFFRPELCALGTRALADQVDVARARGRTVDMDKLGRLAAALVEEATLHIDALAQPPARLCAMTASARAETSRLGQSDPSLWRDAAQLWNDAHEPYGVAYCRWRAADAALAQSKGRKAAVDDLRAAWDIASNLGSPALRANVERLARRARIDLAETGTTPTLLEQVADDLGLTGREVEVLDELARGHTDRQIAEELFISKKTVSVHVSSILRKLDATNRVDAGEIGQRAGLGHDSS